MQKISQSDIIIKDNKMDIKNTKAPSQMLKTKVATIQKTQVSKTKFVIMQNYFDDYDAGSSYDDSDVEFTNEQSDIEDYSQYDKENILGSGRVLFLDEKWIIYYFFYKFI